MSWPHSATSCPLAQWAWVLATTACSHSLISACSVAKRLLQGRTALKLAKVRKANMPPTEWVPIFRGKAQGVRP